MSLQRFQRTRDVTELPPGTAAAGRGALAKPAALLHGFLCSGPVRSSRVVQSSWLGLQTVQKTARALTYHCCSHAPQRAASGAIQT